MQSLTSARCAPAQPTAARPALRRTPGRQTARPQKRVRSFEFEVEDTPGVASLLERDRKSADLSEEALAAFSDDPAAAAAAGAGAQKAAPQQQQEEQQRGPASQRADKLRGGAGTPVRAREAIEQGLQAFQNKEYQAALDLFQLSLELPGSGVMRMSGSVREYSCPSEGEENAALYNMACVWAAMGQQQSALTVLEALLENNFDDYAAIRADPDLASLRGPDLDRLLTKHDGLLAKLFGGKKKEPSSNKPWLQW